MSKETEERKAEIKEERKQLFSLRKPEIRAQIKELKAKGEYDEIYSQYGRTAYSLYVPRKYKKQDLKKLKKEGKYEDIYNKYGESEYNKLLTSAMYKEIKAEKGWLSAIAWRGKEYATNLLKQTGLFTLIASTTLSGALAFSTEASIRENAETYKTDIQSYQEHIEDYTNKVRAANLDDVHTIMEVMDNMWESIQGYKNPEKNISGFLELDLANEDGFGVCRNMSSDVAQKLKKLGYNARTLTVYMEDGKYKPADINRKILEIPEELSQEGENNTLNDFTKYTGNHMILLVDIPEDNIILAIDPTNAGLGIYKDGQISMFNSGKEDGLTISPRQYSEAVFIEGGVQGPIDVMADYMKSFNKPNLTDEELEAKYGLEAQNKALAEVRAMKIADMVFEDSYSHEESDFDSRYKTSQEVIDKTIQVGLEANEKQVENNQNTIIQNEVERE